MSRLFNYKSLSLTHFLVFLLLLGNIGCQKELSKDTLGSGGVIGGGGGNATGGAEFVLVPSGSNCSDAAVAGTFEAGVALGIDAIMTVTVNVTKTGDWTYSTALVNGFAFAGAGNFTATGSQVITLQGVGKPMNTGNSNFNLKIGGGTCFVSVAVLAAGSGGNGGGGNPTGDFYYKANIGGTNYMQDVTSTNGFGPSAGVDPPSSNDVTFGGGISYNGSTLPAGGTEFGVVKGIMHNFSTATQAQIKAFLAPGSYSYSPAVISAPNIPTGDGISLYWIEPGQGDMWVTRNGPADQVGSTFTIVSNTDAMDSQGTPYMKVKVQFSCKFYSVTNGASKTVTNGEAVVAFTYQ